MTDRCSQVKGAGDSLQCCRVPNHGGSCHRRWSGQMRGAPAHHYGTRAAEGRFWLVGSQGADLDVAAA